jgi:hypothetical protein
MTGVRQLLATEGERRPPAPQGCGTEVPITFFKEEEHGS